MGSFIRVLVCVHMFMLFHFFACLSSHHSCHSEESSALLHFINTELSNDTYSFYEDECHHVYPKTSTWENGTDCCSWMGVTCHSVSGHVIGLDLSCSTLKGNIHPNSTLFHLTHLQTLNLAFNVFYGSHLPLLPSQFERLVSLIHLNLSACWFEGDIPFQISHLSKLQSLDLSFNHRLKWKETTWKRLLQNATALREIVLDSTDMSSITTTFSNWSFSFPLVTLSLVNTGIRGHLTSHILCLPNLHELYLSGNENIQVHVLKLNCSTSLNFLYLSRCQFPRSQIPPSFSNLTHLTYLDLSYNTFTSPIPSFFSNLQHLTHLDLSFNEFSGSIPSFLSNLQHLTHLDLSYNRFNGQFPKVIGQLTKLQTLILAGNNLGGKLLLSSLANLTQISQLDCSHNKFQGPLPNKITGFSSLTKLYLNDNLLSETIPSWIFSLPFLTALDLSNNQFTGHMSAISSLSLRALNLCGNKLQGNVPESMFNLVNLSVLCLSGNWSGPLHFSLFSKFRNLGFLSLSGFNSFSPCSETNAGHQFTDLFELKLFQVDLTNFSKISCEFPVLKTLELSENKLEGKVSQWIHDMHSLEYLKLSHNQLSSVGQFPWYQLVNLDLSFNLLSDISFICNAPSLQILNLSHNKFRGTIPRCLANSSNLEVLDLQMNKLHGTLPSTFPRNLISLNLNGNQLEGHLPRSLSNCEYLMDLNLGNNQIEDRFPNWLQSLQNLRILVLQSNKLYGPIVSLKTKDAFSHLLVFDISSNNFSGQLPKAYIKSFQAMKGVFGEEVQISFDYFKTYSFGGISPINIRKDYEDSLSETIKGVRLDFEKIPTILAFIDVSGNKFEGEIPDVIGELHKLKGLNLSHNRLVGHIPHSLGNLTNLESLDLSSNMLTGNIPTKLTNLNFLEVLNLSQNQLVGPIPKGKQFDAFSNDSYEGNMGLCGFPLSIQCNNNVPLQHDPPSEAEDKFGFGWKPVAIGYAFGMVLGIGLGYCVFSIGKPQWLVILFGGKRIKRRSRGNRRARTTLFQLFVVM
ncbi:hypothetical protein S245_057997 [Arachis hypogaea]